MGSKFSGMSAKERAALKALVSGAGMLGSAVRVPASLLGGPALPKTRLRIAAALAGIADFRIIKLGDSTGAGLSSVIANSKWAFSPTAVMARALKAMGLPVNYNSVWGDQTRQGGAVLTSFDPRWTTAGTAWATVGVNSTVGGWAMANSTTTETLKFSPTDPTTSAAYAFDSYDLYSVNLGGYASFTTDIGGAQLAAVDNNLGRSLRITTVPTGAAAATGVINIKRVNTGTYTQIVGIAPRVAATKHIEIFNAAAGSYSSADIDVSSGANGDFLLGPVVRRWVTDVPSLVFIDIGINNWRLLTLGTTDVNYQTVLSNTVSTLIGLGAEVILCKPVPSQIGYSATLTQANMDAYRAAIDAVADQYGCLVYDKSKRFVSYAYSSPLGYYSDGLHPSQAGYAQIGYDLADIIMSY